MRSLVHFWQSLERVPGLATVPAFWHMHCGPDYALIQPWLAATATVGAIYPCPNPSAGHCPRRIADYGAGKYAALCRDPHRVCPDIPLTPREVLLHELDVGALAAAVAPLLGVQPQAPALRGDATWAIGTSKLRSTYGQPVFLIIVPQTMRFLAALEDLLFDVPGPFLVLAPSNRHRSVIVQERMQSRGIGFVALEDSIGVDDNGAFALLDAPGAAPELRVTPVADRRRVVKEFVERNKCKVKDIQMAAGVDEADYYKWLNGVKADHLSFCVAIERVLRDGLSQRQ
jgi:hypothetical protein